MLHPEVKGAIAFGLMEGVVIVMGIIIGVFAAGLGKLAVVSAALVGGLADSFANAVGTHVSQEVEGNIKNRHVWASTGAVFLSTILVVALQVLPLIFFSLTTGIILAAAIGLGVMFSVGFFVKRSLKLAFEYMLMAIIAAALAFGAGLLIKGIIE